MIANAPSLSSLVAAVVEADERLFYLVRDPGYSEAESTRLQSDCNAVYAKLAGYIVAHRAEIAERERLERAVIEAWHALRPVSETGVVVVTDKSELMKAEAALAAFLVRSASKTEDR